LTTRIECSRAHCGDRRQSLRTSATPQIIAGKRADTIWGKTIFPLHPWRGAGTHFSGIPEGKPVKSRSIHEPSPRIAPRNRAPEPWENASREPLETALLRHSFQDANYHDQIVNDRKRASMAFALPARTREPIPEKMGSAATQRKISRSGGSRQAAGKIRVGGAVFSAAAIFPASTGRTASDGCEAAGDASGSGNGPFFSALGRKCEMSARLMSSQ